MNTKQTKVKNKKGAKFAPEGSEEECQEQEQWLCWRTEEANSACSS